jgi:hypothetical protein
MTPTREQIYTALLAALKKTAGFQVITRRYVDPSTLVDAQCPALIQVEIAEHSKHTQKNMPPIATLRVDATVVVCVPSITQILGQEQDVPQALLNPILDAVDAALAPDNPSKNKFTLGGLVEHCYIEGEILKDQGVLFPKAAAVIPIEILLANPATS